MSSRHDDGSAGDANYGLIGEGYAQYRRPDPRIAATIGRAPEVISVEARRYPRIETIAAALGDRTEVIPVPIPFDCTDGFGEAYYGRPECLIDPAARLACSAWSFVEPSVVARFAKELGRDLKSGEWDAKHGHLRKQAHFEGSLKLIISRMEAA
jgi:hypothetical protein